MLFGWPETECASFEGMFLMNGFFFVCFCGNFLGKYKTSEVKVFFEKSSNFLEHLIALSEIKITAFLLFC